MSAVKKYITNSKLDNPNKKYQLQPALAVIINTKNGVSEMYSTMIKHETTYKGFDKWHTCTQITKEEWQNSFNLLRTTTKDTKLLCFQLRAMHHVLTTNRSVAKFKREQCHLCEFCNNHSETIHHLLWKFDRVKLFWEELAQLLNSRCNHCHSLRIDDQLVLFGKSRKKLWTQSVILLF